MEFNLSDTQREFVDEVAELTQQHLSATDGDALDGVKASGLAGLPASGKFGGKDQAGAMELVLAMQTIASNGGSVGHALALNALWHGAVASIAGAGSDAHQAENLAGLVGCERYGARAYGDKLKVEESADGSLTVNGTAAVASAGQSPDSAIVFVGEDDQQTVLLLSIADTAGLTWQAVKGSELTGADQLVFENVAVDKDRCMSKGITVAKLQEAIIAKETLAITAYRLGLLQKLDTIALAATRKLTRQLKLKGLSAQKYQMLTHKMAEFKIGFDATELMVMQTAWKQDQKGASSSDVAMAAMALDSTLLPCALELVKLQRDYSLDLDNSWSVLLTEIMDFGRDVAPLAQLRESVRAELTAGRA